MFPNKVDVLCGYTCNNNCLFCFIKGRKTADGTTSQIKKILNNLRAEGFSEVIFNGGESTIRRDFIELVGYASELGFPKVNVSSNGRMFCYKDFARKAAEAGLTNAIISMHGSNAKTHDMLTRVPGSFKQTMKGMDNLIGVGVKTMSNTTIAKQNYAELPQIVRLLSDLDLIWREFIFVHPGGAALQNFESVVPTLTEIAPSLRKAFDPKRGFTNLGVESVPYCFMKGCEKFVVIQKMEARLVGMDFQIADVNKSRREEAKIKSPGCSRCKYNDKCEGVWRAYAERYGLGELRPC